MDREILILFHPLYTWHMEKRYISYGLVLLTVLVLLTLGTGCRTHVGLGFGFGHKKSSITLKVSSALPRENSEVWAIQGRTFLSEEGQQIIHTFPAVRNV